MHLEDIVTYAILIAVVAAVILMITGRFLDLSVERQESLQSRSTINLLQKIVTEAPFIVTDSNGNKLKLMIDKDAYRDPAKQDLTECCDSVQYDYRFVVGKNSGYNIDVHKNIVQPIDGPIKSNYELETGGSQPAFDLRDPCYFSFAGGTRAGASVPVNICSGNDLNTCEQGIAHIETVDSPLSQLSFAITQACNSEFDFSKRIPLADNDYKFGFDVTIEDGKVCFGNACKKFSCEQEIELVTDQNLLKQSISTFSPTTCDFVRVAKIAGKMFLFEGEAEPEIVEGATDLPLDHDEWTEDEPWLHFSTDQGYVITDEDIGIPKSAGDKYVVFRDEDGLLSTLKDKKMYLNIKDVPGHETLDCGGTCVDMRARGLHEIKFNTFVYSGRAEGTAALLTWTLWDSSGNCIQKDFGIAGGGKEIAHDYWETKTVRLLGNDVADQSYGGCPGNFLGPDPYPSDFDWKITRIDWDVCETVLQLGVVNPTCVPAFSDELKALAIDNFYFKAGGAGG